MAMLIMINGELPTITYTDSARDNTTSTTTFTYTGLSIGTPRADRLIIVGSGRAESTCTVNGASLTLAGPFTTGRFFYGVVPTGTTATIVTTGASTSGSTCFVWSVTGLNSYTPVDINNNFGTGSSVSVSLNGLDKGVCAIIGSATTAGSNNSIAGTSGAVQDAIQNNPPASQITSAGGHISSTITGSFTVTSNCTSGGAGFQNTCTAITFR